MNPRLDGRFHESWRLAHRRSSRYPAGDELIEEPGPGRFPQACPGNVARLAAIGLALLGSACVGPGQAGDLNPQALRDADDYSAARRGHSLLVSQHGRVVFERVRERRQRPDDPQDLQRHQELLVGGHPGGRAGRVARAR